MFSSFFFASLLFFPPFHFLFVSSILQAWIEAPEKKSCTESISMSACLLVCLSTAKSITVYAFLFLQIRFKRNQWTVQCRLSLWCEVLRTFVHWKRPTDLLFSMLCWLYSRQHWKCEFALNSFQILFNFNGLIAPVSSQSYVWIINTSWTILEALIHETQLMDRLLFFKLSLTLS